MAGKRSGEGAMFELFVGVIVGFAAGYGVREIISQRRRVAARKYFLLKQLEEADLLTSRQFHIDRLKLVAQLGIAETKLQR
jgi:hypothetical protein